MLSFTQNAVETRSISRARCTEFYELHRNLGKKYTVQHFKSENVAASTVYHILRSPTTARTQGSGRPTKIMDAKRLRSLSRAFNNKDSLSQREEAKNFNCSHQYICKTLKRVGIKCRKKPRAPEYTDAQISTLNFQCRWLIKNYSGKSFVLEVTSLFRRRRFPETIDTIQRIVLLHLRT